MPIMIRICLQLSNQGKLINGIRVSNLNDRRKKIALNVR